jgi:hypothetical protein
LCLRFHLCPLTCEVGLDFYRGRNPFCEVEARAALYCEKAEERGSFDDDVNLTGDTPVHVRDVTGVEADRGRKKLLKKTRHKEFALSPFAGRTHRNSSVEHRKQRALKSKQAGCDERMTWIDVLRHSLSRLTSSRPTGISRPTLRDSQHNAKRASPRISGKFLVSKFNLLQVAGYRVLVYTPDQVTRGEWVETLRALLTP